MNSDKVHFILQIYLIQSNYDMTEQFHIRNKPWIQADFSLIGFKCE